MNQGDREIVPELQAALLARVGAERFDLWFGRGVNLEVSGGALLVSAADDFVAERLRTQFRHDLAEICRDLLGVPTSIQFVVSSAVSQSLSSGGPAETANDSPPESTQPPAVPELLLESLPSAPRNARRLATLEGFVAGEGNRVAHTAARHTVNRLGAVSPLFLYGPTGSGKTHLLEGILGAVRRAGSARRSLLVSAEQFTSQFLEALQGSGLPSFRRKYRDLDLLLIDDVHFFAGKRATLVELLHTLDTLHRDGRQLVFAADRPPADLSGLGPELAARMSAGLVSGIESADAETRLGILKQLCTRCEFPLPRAVLELLAEQLPGDARQLAGAVNRLWLTAEALGKPINVDLAQRTLADIVRATRRVVRLPDIERAVCEVFGVSPQTLHSAQKSRAVSQPRMLVMWLARKFTRAPLSEIGQHFGRSHSTVIAAQKQVNEWMTCNAALRVSHGECPIDDAIRRVEAQLRTG